MRTTMKTVLLVPRVAVSLGLLRQVRRRHEKGNIPSARVLCDGFHLNPEIFGIQNDVSVPKRSRLRRYKHAY